MKKIFILLLIIWSITYSLAAQTTDSLIVTESGNVGVGTETPQAKLDVNGSLKAGDANIEDLTAVTVNADAVNGPLNSSQLDYIYAGNQIIVDYWNSTVTTTPTVLALAYKGDLLGEPIIPNPDPENYKLCYYFSATGGTSGAADAEYISVNDKDILGFYYNGGGPYRYVARCNFFESWNQFPVMSAGYYGNGLIVKIKTYTGSIIGFLWGLTVHYVYIRNGVDYPKLFP